jgi:restriction endonuclease Mrr
MASAANEKYEGYHIGNTFGLGGDPTVTGTGICDFPAVDVVIVDAKIYMGALTAEEVATAYQAAIAPYAAE